MAVQRIIYPKQEQAYRDAVDRGDWYAANLFYMPPIYRPWEQIEMDMKFERMEAEFKAEQKFVDELQLPRHIANEEARNNEGIDGCAESDGQHD